MRIRTLARSWLLITLGLERGYTEKLQTPREHGKSPRHYCWTSVESTVLFVLLNIPPQQVLRGILVSQPNYDLWKSRWFYALRVYSWVLGFACFSRRQQSVAATPYTPSLFFSLLLMHTHSYTISLSPTLALSLYCKALVNVPWTHCWWQMVKAGWKLPK